MWRQHIFLKDRKRCGDHLLNLPLLLLSQIDIDTPMPSSIFDSKSEEKLYKRLKTYWSRYVDVFPQLPVSKVASYQDFEDQNLNSKTKEFLKKSSFDFVICDRNTYSPILVIEFDGLTGGFSRNGKYVSNKKGDDVNDPYRALKMQAKLDLCNNLQIPMVVVSYSECEVLQSSEFMLTILDAIIGDAIENNEAFKNYSVYSSMLSAAAEEFGTPGVDVTMIEIDLLREQANPVKSKIRNITRKFPRWPTTFHFTRPDENGNLTQTFKLGLGLQAKDGGAVTKSLLSVTVSMRQVGCAFGEPVFLLNTIGEYCLAMKTKKHLGYDRATWQSAYDNAEWTKI